MCGVDIDFYNGEFIGIIGKNGSGKTTLAKTFNGLYKPTSGKVLLSFGGNTYDSSEEDVGFLSRYIGYCFQNPDDQIFLRKVRDEVGYGLKNMKLSQEEQEKRINDAIEVTELTPFADRPPY